MRAKQIGHCARLIRCGRAAPQRETGGGNGRRERSGNQGGRRGETEEEREQVQRRGRSGNGCKEGAGSRRSGSRDGTEVGTGAGTRQGGEQRREEKRARDRSRTGPVGAFGQEGQPKTKRQLYTKLPLRDFQPPVLRAAPQSPLRGGDLRRVAKATTVRRFCCCGSAIRTMFDCTRHAMQLGEGQTYKRGGTPRGFNRPG